MATHPKIEPLRKTLAALDAAPVYAQIGYARGLLGELVTLLEDTVRRVDALERPAVDLDVGEPR